MRMKTPIGQARTMPFEARPPGSLNVRSATPEPIFSRNALQASGVMAHETIKEPGAIAMGIEKAVSGEKRMTTMVAAVTIDENKTPT